MAEHMPSAVKPRDFTLFFSSDLTTDAEMRAAFRGKWNWVIASPSSRAAWYAIVLGNLASHYWSPGEMKIDLVRETLSKGLQKSAFDRLKSLTATSGEDLGEVVRIPARTLARRSVFKPEESERILRVASAFQRAIEVLGDLDKARRWFSSPKKALGEKTPMEFCDTEPGAQEVTNLLGRIEHGVFS